MAGAHHVLLVEDDPSLRLLCRVNLELAGFTVSEAGRLAEARAAVAGGGVDVVLLDVRLGPDDGLDLLAELRDGRPDLPVVLLTGDPVGDVTGASAVLTKPFDVLALADCVQRVLR